MRLIQYLTLIFVLSIIWASLFITILDQNAKINNLIIQEHQRSTQTLQAIQIDTKDYTACLLALNPAQTQAQIKVGEQTCFNNTLQDK